MNNLKIKFNVIDDEFEGFGAEGGTRTRTDCSTRPSNVRGYQLRHLST